MSAKAAPGPEPVVDYLRALTRMLADFHAREQVNRERVAAGLEPLW